MPRRCPAFAPGITPIATGRPGLIATRQNTSRPTFSTASRTWSASPVETPPEVSTRSWPGAAAAIACASAAGSSLRMPRSVTVGAEPLQHAGEQIAVGVVERGGGPRSAGLDDLVAGREQRDPHAPAHGEPRQPDRGGERHVLRREPPAGRKQQRALAHVLAGKPPVGAGLQPRGHDRQSRPRPARPPA